MSFAEQQGDTILHDDSGKWISYAWSALPQRYVFAEFAPLLMEVIWQDVIQGAIQNAIQDVELPHSVWIVGIPRDQFAESVKHIFPKLMLPIVND
jgi:hypothetical protein